MVQGGCADPLIFSMGTVPALYGIEKGIKGVVVGLKDGKEERIKAVAIVDDITVLCEDQEAVEAALPVVQKEFGPTWVKWNEGKTR